MSVKIFEENWQSIQSKVLEPLWNGKFKNMYEQVKMDESDFFSLANLELTKAFKNYDSGKSNVYTYATNVVVKKAFTELRNCTQREKRKALYLSESLDMPISEESEGGGINLITDKDRQEDVSPLMQRYMDSLTPLQYKVVKMLIDGYSNKEIKTLLDLSDIKFRLVWNEITSKRKIEPLEVLRRRMRNGN